jgi:hypothetical protein
MKVTANIHIFPNESSLFFDWLPVMFPLGPCAIIVQRLARKIAVTDIFAITLRTAPLLRN